MDRMLSGTHSGNAKRRLLEASEILFAERGFEAVSVRDMTTAAKMNVAAVNYHFGSRDGLVAAVISRYVTPINEERLALLDEAEKRHAGKAVPLTELLDILLKPLISQIGRSELSERLFCSLVGRMFSMREAFGPVLEEQFRKVMLRILKAFSKALPKFSEEECLWRIQFISGAYVHALTQVNFIERMSDGVSGRPMLEQTYQRLSSFALAGLTSEAGTKSRS